MIDNWFKKDLERIYITHPMVVIIDESKEAAFLLEEVKNNYQKTLQEPINQIQAKKKADVKNICNHKLLIKNQKSLF